MECCNSYTVDGHEPYGKTTLADYPGLEFPDIFVFFLIV